MFDITIRSIEDNNITKLNGVSLDWLEQWLKTKKHSFENNVKQGAKMLGKHNNKPQLKKQIK